MNASHPSYRNLHRHRHRPSAENRWAIAVCATGLVFAAAAAAKIAPVPLSEVIAEAQAIVVGRVISSSPVEFEFEGTKHVCGFEYKAEVEQSFTSSARTIEFFDPLLAGESGEGAVFVPQDRLGDGDRFLAFLFHYDVASLEARAEAMHFETDLLKATYLCRVRSSNVTVNDIPRTLMRFVRIENVDWLPVPEFGPYPSEEVRLLVVKGRNLLRWDDVRNQIERETNRGANPSR